MDEEQYDDEDWFYESFKRYGQLQMFDFPKVVDGMELTSRNNLCVSLEDNSNSRHEILVFQFPTSLKNDQLNDWKVDRHLSFDQGYYTSSRLVQMKCVSNEEKLIISEENEVPMLNIKCEDSGCVEKLCTIPSEGKNARISVNSMQKIVALCGSATENAQLVDYELLKTVHLISEPDLNNYSPLFLSENLISHFNRTNGACHVYDIRDGKKCAYSEPRNTSSTGDCRWVADSAFEIQGSSVANTYEKIYSLSTNGLFLIYDCRQMSLPVTEIKHSMIDNANAAYLNGVKMRICPRNEKRLSLCGFDDKVHIAEITEKSVEEIFLHDGHSYNNDCFESNVRSICSLWLPFVSNDILISSGSNTSVQCWQFKLALL